MKKMRTAYLVYAGNLTKYKIGGLPVVIRAKVNEFGVANVLSPKVFVLWWPVVSNVTPETGWLECSGPARIITNDEFKEFVWQLFVAKAFILADLPEVDDENLSSGLLTNQQIAQKFLGDPDGLYDLAEYARRITGVDEKRRFMSLKANREDQDSIE